MAYRLAERRLGEMMAEQPKAKNNVEYRWQDTGLSETPVLPITLASAGIDKSLAYRCERFPRPLAAAPRHRDHLGLTLRKSSAAWRLFVLGFLKALR
jgi:hypothetical protein